MKMMIRRERKPRSCLLLLKLASRQRTVTGSRRLLEDLESVSLISHVDLNIAKISADIGSKDGSATVSSPSTFKLPPATSKRYTVTIEDDDELESFEKQTSNSLFD